MNLMTIGGTILTNNKRLVYNIQRDRGMDWIWPLKALQLHIW